MQHFCQPLNPLFLHRSRLQGDYVWNFKKKQKKLLEIYCLNKLKKQKLFINSIQSTYAKKLIRASSLNKSLMYFSVNNGPGGNAIFGAFGGVRDTKAQHNSFFLSLLPDLNRSAFAFNAFFISSLTSL